MQNTCEFDPHKTLPFYVLVKNNFKIYLIISASYTPLERDDNIPTYRISSTMLALPLPVSFPQLTNLPRSKFY